MTDEVKPVKPVASAPRKRRLSHMLGGLVGWVVLLTASFFAAQLVVSYVILGLIHIGVMTNYNSTIDQLMYRLIVYIVMVAMIAGVVWYRYRKLTMSDTGITRLPEWSDIGLGAVGAVVYILASVVALSLASNIPGFNETQSQDLGFSHLFGSDLVVGFIVLVILTPLFEEAIFRGFLYGRLRGLKFPWWISAIVVSVLFGLAHMQWNVGIDVFCLSMVACILREMTGSIWSGVLLHVAKNFLAFMVTFVFIQGVSGS